MSTKAQQSPIFSFDILTGPSGVAVDIADAVYVTDSSGKVLKVAAGSSTSTPLPFDGLVGPTGVAVDRSFNVYVADWGDGRVLKLPPPPGE